MSLTIKNIPGRSFAQDVVRSTGEWIARIYMTVNDNCYRFEALTDASLTAQELREIADEMENKEREYYGKA